MGQPIEQQRGAARAAKRTGAWHYRAASPPRTEAAASDPNGKAPRSPQGPRYWQRRAASIAGLRFQPTDSRGRGNKREYATRGPGRHIPRRRKRGVHVSNNDQRTSMQGSGSNDPGWHRTQAESLLQHSILCRAKQGYWRIGGWWVRASARKRRSRREDPGSAEQRRGHKGTIAPCGCSIVRGAGTEVEWKGERSRQGASPAAKGRAPVVMWGVKRGKGRAGHKGRGTEAGPAARMARS